MKVALHSLNLNKSGEMSYLNLNDHRWKQKQWYFLKICLSTRLFRIFKGKVKCRSQGMRRDRKQIKH